MILAFYYQPTPDEATSRSGTSPTTSPRLARPRHAQVGRERLHHPALPAHGASVPVRRLQVPAELNWIVGFTLLVLGMLQGFTGYLPPWDQTAYWATVVGINLNGTAR